jgi:hypothetical protein
MFAGDAHFRCRLCARNYEVLRCMHLALSCAEPSDVVYLHGRIQRAGIAFLSSACTLPVLVSPTTRFCCPPRLMLLVCRLVLRLCM